MNNRKNNSNQNAETQEIYAAKLAYIGSALATLGDGLTTIAAGITLELLLKSKNQGDANSGYQSAQTENMQKQIDYLISELKQMKKILK